MVRGAQDPIFCEKETLFMYLYEDRILTMLHKGLRLITLFLLSESRYLKIRSVELRGRYVSQMRLDGFFLLLLVRISVEAVEHSLNTGLVTLRAFGFGVALVQDSIDNSIIFLCILTVPWGLGWTRLKAWDDVNLKTSICLSKWESGNPSRYGGSKACFKVMESIRSNFFNRLQHRWSINNFIGLRGHKVLDSSKKIRGSGKRFDGDKIDSHSVRKVSIWSSILKEVQEL
ncbi:hypothetical protein Tco_0405574 [Tanacetum coccineum]